jgi:hypothetical protein
MAGIVLFSLIRWSPYISADTIPPRQFLAHAPAEITLRLQQEVHPGERLFAAQGWASWFELKLPLNPVAVDSRIEIFPSEVWDDYISVVRGKCGWQAILDRWNIDVAVLHHEQQKHLIPLMRTDPGWKYVYQDDDGIIFRRVSSIAPSETDNRAN